MTIRLRIAVWYSAMVGISTLLMLGVLYYELSVERQTRRTPEDASEQMSDILLHYGLPSAVLMVFGGYWLTRRILDPVAGLARAIERVQADNLGVRLIRSGNGDELDRLVVLFNSMLDRLEDFLTNIREFTLNASHELKTPLTILSGEIQNLLSDPRTIADHQDALAGQLNEVLRLARIVDDLSLLTKADAGLIRFAQAQVSLDRLILEIKADAEVLAAGKNISIDCPACDQIAVTGDHDRLRQLLLNLIDNAVKFNVPQGRVRIALRSCGGVAELRISNTGPIIPAMSLPRVFERFYRGENAMLLQAGGSGLGLCLSRWIAESHGGILVLQSGAGGTEAIVRLPLASNVDP